MVEIAAQRILTPAARRTAAAPTLAILGICAVLLCLRRAEALTHPQFWAEDAYFFQRAYVLGPSALLEQYAGYYHTILRLVAWAAVAVDPARAPGIFAACSALLTLYVAGRTLSARCPLPRLWGAFAFALVLVPDTYEVFLNVVNLQWVTAAALVLLLISRDPEDTAGWVHDLASAALIALTGPFSIIMAPLFALRAFRRRTRASAWLGAVVCACALVQALSVLTQPSADSAAAARFVPALVLPAIGRRVGASIILGALTAASTPLYTGAAVGVVTLAGVAYLALRRAPIREERIMLGLAFAGLLAGSLFRTRHFLEYYFTPLADGRYVFLPQLIALWLLLAAAAESGRAGRLCRLLCLVALLANLPRMREPAYADLHWERYAPMIREGRRVVVPTNPPGWWMPLPARGK